jgi:hypothetical protein
MLRIDGILVSQVAVKRAMGRRAASRPPRIGRIVRQGRCRWTGSEGARERDHPPATDQRRQAEHGDQVDKLIDEDLVLCQPEATVARSCACSPHVEEFVNGKWVKSGSIWLSVPAR